MSLINDALKRASQVETPPPSTPLESLQPVNYGRAARLPLILLPLIFVAVLGAAGWFLLKGWEATRQQKAAAAAVPVAARTVTVTVPPLTPASAQIVDTAVEPAPEAPAATVTPVAPPVEEPPSFPKLKLQAIFYRPQNASVIINARTLQVGGKVQQAEVVSIGRETVIVEWQGERRELVLP